MVKIVHMADTHLGYRTKRGTINRWAQLNYSRPYEQEIYDTFLKVMENVSKIDNLNFFIHCGDIFHIPQKNNPFPPPEPARRVLKQGFDLFFNNTKNEVPLIYIEGNHGVFQGYDYTPFESHFNFNEYPNLHYFKERDLLDALKSNSSLMLEFNQQKVRFYLFPFFDFDSFEVYSSAYDSWIENQCPKKNDGFINIAVAHGSKIDKTLHKKILSDEFDYDYVALGHEHILKKETKNSFYAGSLLPLNFKEINQNQGYLIINIDEKTRKLDVEKIFTHKLLNRPFEKIQINVIPNDSSIDLNNKIQDVLKNFTSKKGFNAKTSARLKLEFIGEITYERNWQINDIMSKTRRDIFSQSEKFNILQLIWEISDVSEMRENDISPGIIEDYILEHPDDEFKQFVEEKLSDEKSNFNIEKLTQFGIGAIKKALKRMEKEKEV